MDELRTKDPHDRFFKTVMADPRNVKDFIKEFLPHEVSREIDLTHVKHLPTERMNKNAKYCMDLAVECNVGGEKTQIYFVFEHKSYPDDRILLQILGYMYAIWEEQKRKNQPLTPIIPVVVYHGSQSWNITRSFSEQFHKLHEVVKPYMPEFNYILVDLTLLGDEEIWQKAKENPFLAGALWAMKCASLQKLGEIRPKAGIIITSDDEKTIILEYLIHTLDVPEEIMSEIAKGLGGEEVMPSLAEKLEKRGELKGKEIGKEIGKIEAKRSTLIKLLKRKFGLTLAEEEELRSVTDEAKLEAALDMILDAKDKSEVLRTLG
ncbi:MAG: Uncharacterized protein XD68_1373 [Synergistales bacterium 54_24]|nr:MAG: Uncharacterized protein XD68_1373 [Synergistales bacterium 54_24]